MSKRYPLRAACSPHKTSSTTIPNIMTSLLKQFVVALVTLVSFATFASAQVISVSFSAPSPPFGFGPFYLLGPSETAGVVPVSNWNNVTGTSGVVTGFIDDSASSTTLSLNITPGAPNYGHWGFFGAGTSDQRMLGAFLENPFPTTPFSISLSSIPYSLYDIYIYSGPNADRTGLRWEVSNGTTSYFGIVDSTVPTTGYLLTSATTLATAVAANYSVFSNLTGSTQTFTFSGPGAPSLSGFQIVLIPEPSTVMLALLGVAGVTGITILRRRKA